VKKAKKSEAKEPLKAELKVELSSDGETHVIGEDKIVFVTLEPEQGAENPLTDCDGFGSIFSFSTRHSNFKEPAEIFENPDAPLNSAFRSRFEDAVLLSYYEHGACRWAVRGTMTAGNTHHYSWDCVSLAGVWIPDEYLMCEASGLTGAKRIAKMTEWAEQACKVFTDWCNGEVYCFNCVAYKLKTTDSGEVYDELSDYRFEDALSEENGMGYYGYDGQKQAVSDIQCFLGEQFPDREVIAVLK